MKSALIAGFAVLALSHGVSTAQADTSVHDRTLQLSMTDLGHDGGLELILERTYSSASTQVGVFGPGWGSRYETRLVKEADGSLVVYENGCGGPTRFQPVPGKPDSWQSTGCSVQRMNLTPTGYERGLGGGKTETFSRDGRLSRVADANGQWINIAYSGERMAMVGDNLGRSLAFVYGADGRLEMVRDESGREATYGFDQQGRLIRATDVNGAEYRYGYDGDGRLVSEDGPEGSRVVVGYDGGQLASLRDANGFSRYLGYEGEGWREIITVTEDSEGHRASRTRRVILDRADAQGHPRRWRELTISDSRILDTEYNDAGQPAILHDGSGRSAGFRFDSLGRVVHKDSREGTVDLDYDPKSGKLARFERRSGGQRVWATYTYDGRGNLAKAANSDGRRLSLRNDEFGRIISMAENKRRLDFTYNQDAKPLTITSAGKGTIRVTYDDKGEIAKVESDGGPAMALEVTSMFQNLLQLVKPSEVRIGLD
jgi:YD repeat-containing protein